MVYDSGCIIYLTMSVVVKITILRQYCLLYNVLVFILTRLNRVPSCYDQNFGLK